MSGKHALKHRAVCSFEPVFTISGLAVSRNLGIDSLSDSCKWLVFIDSDDFILENYLEKLIDYSASFNVDGVWVSQWDVSEKSGILKFDILSEGGKIT